MRSEDREAALDFIERRRAAEAARPQLVRAVAALLAQIWDGEFPEDFVDKEALWRT